MRFGIGQFTLQMPPWETRSPADVYSDVLDLAVLADSAGFDSFWLAEHHGAGDAYVPSLLPFLAAVGARTRAIGLGTAVMLAPMHNPLRVAEDAAVVDNISRGRVMLGLGLGWVAEEYRMFEAVKRGRGRRLSEFVEVLRLAWSKERFSFQGRHFSFDDVSVTPKPHRAIPVWMGGGADAAVTRAACIADGYFPPSTAGVTGIVECAERVLAARQEAGMSGSFSYGTFLPIGIGRDADDAWASIRDGILHTRGAYMLWAQGRRDLRDAREAAAAVESEVRASCVLGTAPEVVAQLRPVVERLEGLGFDETFISAVLVPPGMPKDRATEAVSRYAEDVLPKLRA